MQDYSDWKENHLKKSKDGETWVHLSDLDDYMSDIRSELDELESDLDHAELNDVYDVVTGTSSSLNRLSSELE